MILPFLNHDIQIKDGIHHQYFTSNNGHKRSYIGIARLILDYRLD